MSKAKKPYQEQIDSLCEELGITEPQYDDKNSIADLEKIIDELEAKLPENSDSEEVEITLTDDVPESEGIEDSVDVEVNSDKSGNIEVKAVSTFRCRVDDERVTVVKDNKHYLPEDVAMEAVEAGVAVLIGKQK
ncbi:hypothetical protein M9194_19725 [Vibrio sp. S4M6]|uniref:hypothetical protein n=1 Tax=Vibrio sinus TaxID=2946865 RepID=UPI00202A8964|nr:hypothetical protein [Vibrio sinus]MCL9783658.1 hypothetical protein [Vibrio sinus]